MSSNNHKKKLLDTSLSLGIPTLVLATALFGISNSIFTAPASATTSTSGAVQLNAEVATAIAMKITSLNDTNPDCMVQSGVTYGVANRYATSNGAEGSKQVDTFDGTIGGADELNSNTSCATLTMTPNTFDSTYSDVTVYTNSPNGYAVSLQAAEPNLVNTTDSTQYIPAGVLTESGNTVPGGQNKWAYKTNNGIITNWTAATTTDSTIKSYDQETSGGDTTRVTYGISAGNNPTGKYATTLTYTATMFDGNNPYVGNIDTEPVSNLSISPTSLKIARNQTKTLTVTPAEGYYLSDVDCPEGYNCSNYTTDKNDPASATTQAISVKNQSASSTATSIGLEVTKLEARDIADATYMQDFGSDTCMNTERGINKVLIDKRDDKTYRVAKLNDNECWMTEDLKLGGDSDMVLTSELSDVQTDFVLKKENTGTWCTADSAACWDQSVMMKTGVLNGYLYNAWAAAAGTFTFGSSELASASICPKGWKLPTRDNYSNLAKAYGGTGGNQAADSDSSTNTAINNLRAKPIPNFNITGYRIGNNMDNDASAYWQANPGGEFLIDPIWGGRLFPVSGSPRYRGYAVRCIAYS